MGLTTLQRRRSARRIAKSPGLARSAVKRPERCSGCNGATVTSAAASAPARQASGHGSAAAQRATARGRAGQKGRREQGQRCADAGHGDRCRSSSSRWALAGSSHARAAAPPRRAAGPRRTGTLSKTHATGCGLMKGEQDPALKPDSEYPAWLWALADVQPTAKDLEARYQGQGLTINQVTAWMGWCPPCGERTQALPSPVLSIIRRVHRRAPAGVHAVATAMAPQEQGAHQGRQLHAGQVGWPGACVRVFRGRHRVITAFPGGPRLCVKARLRLRVRVSACLPPCCCCWCVQGCSPHSFCAAGTARAPAASPTVALAPAWGPWQMHTCMHCESALPRCNSSISLFDGQRPGRRRAHPSHAQRASTASTRHNRTPPPLDLDHGHPPEAGPGLSRAGNHYPRAL